MVRLAGQLADGVITTMAGPRYLEQEVVPILRAAADEADRPTPRVAAHFFVSITKDVEAARRCADALIDDLYAHPMYQRVLQVDGVERFGDVAIVGDETVVAERMDALAEIGVTDLLVSIPVLDGDIGAYERTYQFLAGRASSASDSPARGAGALLSR
jgi:alkanesulfonate monooxygenase SsuD/methylene tetrahydromethanopterin reductase-like flavin-dependent oxidoreductase (luciferase family)